jgi:hypothetical protein
MRLAQRRQMPSDALSRKGELVRQLRRQDRDELVTWCPEPGPPEIYL